VNQLTALSVKTRAQGLSMAQRRAKALLVAICLSLSSCSLVIPIDEEDYVKPHDSSSTIEGAGGASDDGTIGGSSTGGSGAGETPETLIAKPDQYYSLDQTMGTQLLDDGQRPLEAFVSSEAAWRPDMGIKNGAYAIGASNQYLTLAPNTLNDSEFTISWWFNAAEEGYITLFRMSVSNSTQGGITILSDSGAIRVRIEKDALLEFSASSTVAAVSKGRWIHLALSYHQDKTGDLDELRLWMNGIIVISEQAPLDEAFANSESQVRFGKVSQHEGLRPFVGLIDEIRVYQKALDETQVQALYEMAR